MKEFSGPDAFWRFAHEIARESRYLHSEAAERFMRVVGKTCHARTKRLAKDTKLWRAQVGHDWTFDEQHGRKIRSPHPESRMKPLDDRAYEGRVNPKGIPCLYAATSRDVAMSEVRPWIGSTVTVARLRTLRDLDLVDCSAVKAGERSDEHDTAIWAAIDEAFSQPVTGSDNKAEYAATQALAEVFRREGLDGVIYRTAFSAEGKNVALFDLDCAEVLDSALFKVSDARFDFEEMPPEPEDEDGTKHG